MNHIYDIRDNLIRSYIFYIPDSIYEDLNRTAFKGIIKQADLNKLGYFDNDLNVSTNLKLLRTIDFITKSKYLEKNILQLFKAKKELSTSEFNYLLEAYKEHVVAHTFITEELNRNLKKYFQNIDLEIINLFKLQAQAFEKHQKAISTHFGKLEEPNTFNQEEFIKRFQENKFKIASKSSIKKDKKKPLITNEEADDFLLKTIFNVKVTTLNGNI